MVANAIAIWRHVDSGGKVKVRWRMAMGELRKWRGVCLPVTSRCQGQSPRHRKGHGSDGFRRGHRSMHGDMLERCWAFPDNIWDCSVRGYRDGKR